jgi:cytochrome c2
VLLVLAVFVGFELNEHKMPGNNLLRKIDRALARTVDNESIPKLGSQVYSSTLLRLESEVGIVPTERDRSLRTPLSAVGGGLTTFGEDVLVLIYNGNIFAARSAADIRQTNIVAPENNRGAYLALSGNPKFDDYSFDLHYLRYNDLMRVEYSGMQALIASYTEYHPEEACYTNTLAKLDIAADVTSIDEVSASGDDWIVLYRTQPCLSFKTRHSAMEGHMAGGRMAFRAPNEVIFTSGDFHLDGMRSEGLRLAQNQEAEYGKVISVDIETGSSRILSSGHRNPQGITIDSDGDIMVTEHGPSGGDELNLIVDGANYGWPKESFGISYSGQPMPGAVSFGRHETFEAPQLSWVPSIAVSGLTEISGFHSAWDGDLLASSFANGGAINRIRRQNGRVIYSESITIGSRVRYVHQHTNGQIVLWTDNEELIFLSPQENGTEAALLDSYLSSKGYGPRLASRLEAVVGRCSECHSFAIDDNVRAPSLARIYKAPIGETDYASYSDALQSKGGRWTPDNLADFLVDPQGFAPGTAMPPVGDGDGDEEVIDALIGYLRAVNKRF